MGGTYDPATGQMRWVMHVPLPEQLVHYHAHPPRALGELEATPTEVDWTFDGHGEPVNAIFALTCPCGCKRFAATCGVIVGDDGNEICPPIGLECEQCERAFEIFDPSEHGWDAVMCGDSFDEPEAFGELLGTEVEPPHEIIARFEYGSETLGDPDTPELAGREQDAFTWFSLLAREPSTGRLELLFDFECA